MLSRGDRVNNYLMYSERTTLWNDPIILQNPSTHGNLRKSGIVAPHQGPKMDGW